MFQSLQCTSLRAVNAAGPAVHTRSGQPIPAISLSTELPELADLAVKERSQVHSETHSDAEETPEPTENLIANASSGEPNLPAEATPCTESEAAETVEIGADAEEEAVNLARPAEALPANASSEEEILPAEATMSTAVETAEALESDANAKEEALHPTPMPASFEVEQDTGSKAPVEGSLIPPYTCITIEFVELSSLLILFLLGAQLRLCCFRL